MGDERPKPLIDAVIDQHRNGNTPQLESAEDTLARLQQERAIIRWVRDSKTGLDKPIAVDPDPKGLRLHPKDRPRPQNGTVPNDVMEGLPKQ